MEGEEATEISVDNQAAIAISHNLVFYGKQSTLTSSFIFYVRCKKMVMSG